MKLATFNIRCDYGQDGANNFCFRKPYIVKKIRSEAPDILCFQEVLPHIAAWLKETLPEYCVAGCGRSEGFGDEMALIAFKKERFDLVSMDTFWLSRTPYMPGSRYEEQSICPRTATEAILWDLEEKRLYRVVNTHLDHEGSRAREQGLSQIMERLLNPVNFPEAMLLLAGDFNAEPDMPEMELIKRYPQFRDAAASAGPTFHDYGRLPEGEKIDYIFVREPLQFRNTKRWENCENGVYLSDHYPVSVEIYTN